MGIVVVATVAAHCCFLLLDVKKTLRKRLNKNIVE